MAADVQTCTLPVIDLTKAQDKIHRRGIAQQVVHALETVGFLYIDNAPGLDLAALHKNVKQFFSMPTADKLQVGKHKWNPANRNIYRGYFPLEPNDVSHKEGFEIGNDGWQSDDPDVHPMFTEENLWPVNMEEFDVFQKEIKEYYQAVLKAGVDILRLVALGSGLDENWFESMFLSDTLSTLRLLHYPTRQSKPPDSAVDGGKVICCMEHSDSGFVTLLATFNYRGLQIRTQDDEWLDVEPRPNSLVMNIGDILSKISNGRFKATKHRVYDTFEDRYSVPFFFEPSYGAEICRLLPQMDSHSTKTWDADVQKQKYGPWLMSKMQEFTEYKDTIYG